MSRLVIAGAVGYSKVVAEIASKNGYKEIVFLDDNELIKHCMDYPVIGKLTRKLDYQEFDFFVAIGNPTTREKIQNMFIENGAHIATLIHPNAVVSDTAIIGIGTVVMAGAIISSDSKIGRGCIIDTGSSVDHDDVIDDFVHVSVGSHLAGTVCVGKRTWIGAGTIVSNDVSVCNDCMLGAGAVVINNIDVPGTYVGIPAKKIKGPYFK